MHTWRRRQKINCFGSVFGKEKESLRKTNARFEKASPREPKFLPSPAPKLRSPVPELQSPARTPRSPVLKLRSQNRNPNSQTEKRPTSPKPKQAHRQKTRFQVPPETHIFRQARRAGNVPSIARLIRNASARTRVGISCSRASAPTFLQTRRNSCNGTTKTTPQRSSPHSSLVSRDDCAGFPIALSLSGSGAARRILIKNFGDNFIGSLPASFRNRSHSALADSHLVLTFLH